MPSRIACDGKNMGFTRFFYLCSISSPAVNTVFFIGILVPYNNPNLLSGATDATASPLVIAAKLAGVPVLPSIINAVYVLIAESKLCVLHSRELLMHSLTHL